MKYIVTELGPIDRHPPGADVTDVYDAETMDRLFDEGYVGIQGEPASDDEPAEVEEGAEDGS